MKMGRIKGEDWIRAKTLLVRKGSYSLTMLIMLFVVLSWTADRSFPVSHRVEENPFVIVALDVGHGGYDPGKVSGDLLEKDLNLTLTAVFQEELLRGGFLPIALRTEDVDFAEGKDTYQSKKSQDLKTRVDKTISMNADLFLSIHCNAFSGESKGFQTFYHPMSEESQQLAEMVQQKVVEEADPTNHRVAEKGEYYVLAEAPCPAITIEAGFLSSEVDKNRLQDEAYQKSLGMGIAKGAAAFWNG